MANVIIVLALIAIAVIAIRSAVKRFNGGCCGEGDTPVKIKPKDANTAHYKYKTTAYIDGMTCAHCKARVENAFNSLPECCAKVDLKKKCVYIRTNAPLTDTEISAMVEKNGYSFVKSERGRQ